MEELNLSTATEERDALIEQGLPLVADIAAQYEGRGLCADDLFQIGCIGLIRAINEGSDPEPMIRKEIERFLRSC